jgi:hypothetical protein
MQKIRDILANVGVYDKEGNDKLQWPVIYNISELSGEVFVHRNFNNIIKFSFSEWR